MENRLAVPPKIKHKILYYMHVRPVAQLGLTLAYQASLSIGFPRQEYWSKLLFPSPGDLPNPGTGTEPASPMSPTLAGRFFITGWFTDVRGFSHELDNHSTSREIRHSGNGLILGFYASV